GRPVRDDRHLSPPAAGQAPPGPAGPARGAVRRAAGLLPLPRSGGGREAVADDHRRDHAGDPEALRPGVRRRRRPSRQGRTQLRYGQNHALTTARAPRFYGRLVLQPSAQASGPLRWWPCEWESSPAAATAPG